MGAVPRIGDGTRENESSRPVRVKVESKIANTRRGALVGALRSPRSPAADAASSKAGGRFLYTRHSARAWLRTVIQSSTLLPLAIFSNLSQLSTHGEYSSSGGDGDGGGGDAAARVALLASTRMM